MREQIQARRNELKRQLDEGQIELQQVQARENYLREAMLRISGAMQMLDELLTEWQPTELDGLERHTAEPIATNQGREADVSRSKTSKLAEAIPMEHRKLS